MPEKTRQKKPRQKEIRTILGIETSADSAGCAIGQIEQTGLPATHAPIRKNSDMSILAAAEIAEPQKHCENLAPLIEKALKKAQLNSADLDLIAVDVGPGLYTGLRVGISTAVFLAFGMNLPVVGFSSLDTLAYQAFLKNPDIGGFVSVLDARRQEVFYAGYLLEDFSESALAKGAISPTLPAGVAKPQELLKSGLLKKDIVLGGDAVVYAEIFEAQGFRFRRDFQKDFHGDKPKAETLVELAGFTEPAEYMLPEELKPVYLRRPDAVFQRPATSFKDPVP